MQDLDLDGRAKMLNAVNVILSNPHAFNTQVKDKATIAALCLLDEINERAVETIRPGITFDGFGAWQDIGEDEDAMIHNAAIEWMRIVRETLNQISDLETREWIRKRHNLLADILERRNPGGLLGRLDVPGSLYFPDRD